VIVIGGGLAGASTAFSIARRGARVLLLENAPGLCERASGNRFGLLTPYIATQSSPFEALYSAGYSYSRTLLQSPFATYTDFRACGAIQFPSTKRFETLLQDTRPLIGAPDIRRASARECSELSGVPCAQGGFVIPSAGFVSPAKFMQQLLHSVHDRVTVRYGARATALTRIENSWRVTCADNSAMDAANIVVCGAFESANLAPSAWLPLEPIRGQTVAIQSTPSSRSLRMVLCFGGYLTPAVDDEHLLGAHYRHDDNNQEPSDEDTAEIVRVAAQSVPSLGITISDARSARVCFRTSTIDRLPYIGQLPNFTEMESEARSYRSGTDLRRKVALREYAGLYVSAGHGSRGLLTGPLGGEIIARLMNNEPLDSLQAAATLCEPARVPHRLLTAPSRNS